MKQPKFKIWDKKAKIWLDDETMYTYCLMPNGSVMSVDDYGAMDTLENVEVVFFTGLKDKNRKDIYEGDIMKVQGTKRTGIYVTEVIYDAPQFKLRINNTIFHDYAAVNKGEVIGNIYENPELL